MYIDSSNVHAMYTSHMFVHKFWFYVHRLSIKLKSEPVDKYNLSSIPQRSSQRQDPRTVASGVAYLSGQARGGTRGFLRLKQAGLLWKAVGLRA